MVGKLSRFVDFSEKLFFFRLLMLLGGIGKLNTTFQLHLAGYEITWIADIILCSLALTAFALSFVFKTTIRQRQFGLMGLMYGLVIAAAISMHTSAYFWPTNLAWIIILMASNLAFKTMRSAAIFWSFSILILVYSHLTIEGLSPEEKQLNVLMHTLSTFFSVVLCSLNIKTSLHIADNEAFLQKILNETNDAIFVADMNNNIIEVNAQFNKMFATHQDEVKKLNILDLMIERLSNEEANAVHRKMRLDDKARGVYLFGSVDGRREFNCEFSGRIIELKGKEFILARLTDIQENVEAEKRLETIMESSKDGIMVLEAEYGEDGEVKDFVWEMLNDSARKIVEWQDKDVVGHKLSETMNVHLYDRLFPIYVQVMNSGVAQDYENRADYVGEEKWYHTICTRMGNGIILTVRDYTTMKATELELIEAMESAEAGARSKSEFLATMSHEIRTPMNAVMGMSSLLVETPLNDDQKKFVNTIRTGAFNLLTIINDILDYSKIESGKLDLEMQSFNLRQMIEDVMDLLAPKVFDQGIEMVYFIHPKVARYVVSDATRLRQIVLNLLNNAIKFTHEGEVFVEVKVGKENKLQFDIKDTGIGIPEEGMDRLFRTFSQVDSSTTRQYGGTGLGLAICKKLTNLLGGDVWVESEEGVGSTFSFDIEYRPVITAQNMDVELIKPFTEKRAFIVDDNETNRDILSRILSQWNIDSVEFADGKSALDGLEDVEADVFILDMHMPEMDGVELARKIRKAQGDQIPVMLLSSIMTTEIHKDDRGLFDSIMSKPLKHEDLYSELRNVFSEAVVVKEPIVQEPIIEQGEEPCKLSILVAEDNPINQQVALHLFKRIGCGCDLAGNGIEVLEMLQLKSYDLIFMDVQMPEMDGIEATIALKELYGEDAPTIIAMTANAMKGDREKFLAAGMDDYVAKPVCLEELTEKVKEYAKA